MYRRAKLYAFLCTSTPLFHASNHIVKISVGRTFVEKGSSRGTCLGGVLGEFSWDYTKYVRTHATPFGLFLSCNVDPDPTGPQPYDVTLSLTPALLGSRGGQGWSGVPPRVFRRQFPRNSDGPKGRPRDKIGQQWCCSSLLTRWCCIESPLSFPALSLSRI